MSADRRVQLMLSDLWKWRRAGGGDDEENTAPEHQQALQEIQQVKVEEADRMSSDLVRCKGLRGLDRAEIKGGGNDICGSLELWMRSARTAL